MELGGGPVVRSTEGFLTFSLKGLSGKLGGEGRRVRIFCGEGTEVEGSVKEWLKGVRRKREGIDFRRGPVKQRGLSCEWLRTPVVHQEKREGYGS